MSSYEQTTTPPAMSKRRQSSSKRIDSNYVASSRRSRVSKEKVTSVGDYIRTVMQQLKAESSPATSSPSPTPPLNAPQSSDTTIPHQAPAPATSHGHDLTDSDNIHQYSSRLHAASPTSLRPTRAARTNPSSATSPSEQQVWLLIVERMREEIIRARDVHRADLYKSKRSKRKRASFDPSNNNPEQNNADEAKQYCTVCILQQNPAMAITICGHFLCWACLCKWHHKDASSSLTASKKECPCCKKILTKSQVTFIGEKREDALSDGSGDANTTLSLATDQRDKLLQAAALPVLSSRLHGNTMHDMSTSMQSYAPSFDQTALMASTKSQESSGYSASLAAYSSMEYDIMGSGYEEQLYSSGCTEYQTLNAADNMMNSQLTQQATSAGSYIFNDEGLHLTRNLQFELADGLGIGLATTASTTANGAAYPAAGLISSNDNQLVATNYSWSPVNNHDQALEYIVLNSSNPAAMPFSDYHNIALHYGNIEMNPPGISPYEECPNKRACVEVYGEADSAMVGQYIEKVLEIKASDGVFTDTEVKELRELQDTLKQQLAAQRPLYQLQSSAWLSTLLASTSNSTTASTGNYSQYYEELPSSMVDTHKQHLYMDQQAVIQPALVVENTTNIKYSFYAEDNTENERYSSHAKQQALNFSSESTFSTSAAASPSSSTNYSHHNIITDPGFAAAGPLDDALSDWRTVFDDAWDWSINDGLFTL